MIRGDILKMMIEECPDYKVVGKNLVTLSETFPACCHCDHFEHSLECGCRCKRIISRTKSPKYAKVAWNGVCKNFTVFIEHKEPWDLVLEQEVVNGTQRQTEIRQDA